MIKLTVNPESDPTVRIFDKSSVIIGSYSSSLADMTLPGEALQDTHVQIIQQDDRFFIINRAHDPFVTLNGLPFGKKILQSNDLIQIGDTIIRFEGEIQKSQDKESESFKEPLPHISPRQQKGIDTSDFQEKLFDTRENLSPLLEQILQSKKEEKSSVKTHIYPDKHETPGTDQKKKQDFEKLDAEADLEKWKKQALIEPADTLIEDNLSDFEIDFLMRQVEQLEKENQQLNQTSAVNKISDDQHKELPNPKQEPSSARESHQGGDIHALAKELSTASFEDLSPPSPLRPAKEPYVTEHDDENEHWYGNEESAKKDKNFSHFKNWKLLIKILTVLLLAAIIFAALTYTWVSDQSGEEEIKAAKGVADITMALTYAQIKNIKPQNQNWSDPEFIKNNLTAVLASEYPSLADFDTHGQFQNCPYFLRIYTSSDLSQFLVIAQPAPSLSQWLIPKASIILDSKNMKLRKIMDLKALNRLLVNANTLDGINAVEVSNLVSQGELIPLSNFINKKENQGFSPPKALALIRPGAENYIYNAPRYYHLGQNIMAKSLDIMENPGSSQDVAMLQQEIAVLAKFPDLVLYSSEGMELAIQTQKALLTLAPKEKFLIAYLQFNSRRLISNSHLLMDDGAIDASNSDNNVSISNPQNRMTPNVPSLGDNFDSSKDAQEAPLEDSKDKNEDSPESHETIETSHPLFLQLVAMTSIRQQALKPLSDEMISMLNLQNQIAQEDFIPRFRHLFAQYEQENIEQQIKIIKKLSQLYQENTHIPLAQLMGFVKAAGLETVVQESLKKLQQKPEASFFSHEMFEVQLKKIQESTDWAELDKQVSETAEMLKLQQVPDPEKLIAYQNIMRSQVLQKITHFLLSHDTPLPVSAYQEDNRHLLSHILKTAWVMEPDTCDFYLNEFDLRIPPKASN
jgi:hypothetical protein